MRIAVFGATGRIGSRLVKQALVQGHRSPPPFVTLDDPTSIGRAIALAT
jgi:nucleoside-diphosphate-sugar epimerase